MMLWTVEPFDRIFPTDIPEDDEDEIPQMKEKNSRFKKKLKFGVDFDVKKDK